MSNLAERVNEKMSHLPLEKQQTVLDFVDSLSKESEAATADSLNSPEPSAFYKEVVSQYIGCVDSGHTDLSTNKVHMDGFGKK